MLVVAKYLTQPLHDFLGLMQRAVGQDDAKFITAIPTSQVLNAQVVLELLAELAQYTITDDMPVGIIDLLEMVDINQGQGGG